MKFSINQSELLNALNTVGKGISPRASLPILAGVYVETDGDCVIFQTSNQELSIKYRSAALVEEDGSAVFPGKLFTDIVKSLDDAAVSIDASESHARLRCGASSFSIRTLDPRDFPSFPEVEASQSISLPFAEFSQMVKQVSRSVAKDESRPILTGILVEAEDGKLRMVATDSYRLAIAQIATDYAGDFSAVIAGTFLQNVAGLKTPGPDLTIGLSENQIVVECENTVFINRRIEGRFPNYRQLLPDGYNLRATVEVDQLAAAVRRASLVTNVSSPVKCNFQPERKMAVIAGSAQDIGSSEEEVPIEAEGEGMEIAFNGGYLTEGIQAVPSDKVFIELQSPLKPGILRADEPYDFLYLVMPVRIS